MDAQQPILPQPQIQPAALQELPIIVLPESRGLFSKAYSLVKGAYRGTVDKTIGAVKGVVSQGAAAVSNVGHKAIDAASAAGFPPERIGNIALNIGAKALDAAYNLPSNAAHYAGKSVVAAGTYGYNPEQDFNQEAPNRRFRDYTHQCTATDDIANLCRLGADEIVTLLASDQKITELMGEGWLADRVRELRGAESQLLPTLIESLFLQVADRAAHAASEDFPRAAGESVNPEMFTLQIFSSFLSSLNQNTIKERLRAIHTNSDAEINLAAIQPINDDQMSLRDMINHLYVKLERKQNLVPDATTQNILESVARYNRSLYNADPGRMAGLKKLLARAPAEPAQDPTIHTKNTVYALPQLEREEEIVAARQALLIDVLIGVGDLIENQVLRDGLNNIFKNEADLETYLDMLRWWSLQAQNVNDHTNLESYLQIFSALNDIAYGVGDVKHVHAFECFEIIFGGMNKLGHLGQYADSAKVGKMIRKQHQIWALIKGIVDRSYDSLLPNMNELNLPWAGKQIAERKLPDIINNILPNLMKKRFEEIYNVDRNKQAVDSLRTLQCWMEMQNVIETAALSGMVTGLTEVHKFAQRERAQQQVQGAPAVPLRKKRAKNLFLHALQKFTVTRDVPQVSQLRRNLVDLGAHLALLPLSVLVDNLVAQGYRRNDPMLLTAATEITGNLLTEKFTEIFTWAQSHEGPVNNAVLQARFRELSQELLAMYGFGDAQSLPLPQETRLEVYNQILAQIDDQLIQLYNECSPAFVDYDENVNVFLERMGNNNVETLVADLADNVLPIAHDYLQLSEEESQLSPRQLVDLPEGSLGVQLIKTIRANFPVNPQSAVWIYQNIMAFVQNGQWNNSLVSPYIKALLVDVLASVTKILLPEGVEEGSRFLPALTARAFNVIRTRLMNGYDRGDISAQDVARIKGELNPQRKQALIKEIFGPLVIEMGEDMGIFIDRLKMPAFLKPLIRTAVIDQGSKYVYDFYVGIVEPLKHGQNKLAENFDQDLERALDISTACEEVAQKLVSKSLGLMDKAVQGLDKVSDDDAEVSKTASGATSLLNTALGKNNAYISDDMKCWLGMDAADLFKDANVERELSATTNEIITSLLGQVTTSAKHLLTDTKFFKKAGIMIMDVLTNHLNFIRNVRVTGLTVSPREMREAQRTQDTLYQKLTTTVLHLAFPRGVEDLPVPKESKDVEWNKINAELPAVLEGLLGKYVSILSDQNQSLDFVRTLVRSARSKFAGEKVGRDLPLTFVNRQAMLQDELVDLMQTGFQFAISEAWNKTTEAMTRFESRLIGPKRARALNKLNKLIFITILANMLYFLCYPIVLASRFAGRKIVNNLGRHAVTFISRPEHILLLKNMVPQLINLLGDQYANKDLNPAEVDMDFCRSVAQLVGAAPEILPSKLLSPLWRFGSNKIAAKALVAAEQNIPDNEAPIDFALRQASVALS